MQAKWNRDYQKRLSRCRVEIDYQKYVENQKDPANIVRVNHNGLSFRDIALFIRRDGELDPNAYTKMQVFLSQHPECKILFGDEDMLGEDGTYSIPVFRGAFGREEWLQCFSLGSVIAVDKALAPDLENEIVFDNPEEVRGRLEKLLITAGAYEIGNHAVAHIPEILFHGSRMSFEKEMPMAAPVAKVELHALSVVIPSKDHPEILKQCVDTLCKSSCGYPLEILVVDNGSSEENRKIIEAYLADRQTSPEAEHVIVTKYIYQKEDFNFSKMSNAGAKAATGDILLFLNDDIEATRSEWLERMLQLVAKPYIGAVGSKLYYPGGKKIQHLGVQNLPGGPVHKYQFQEETEDFYALESKNVLAVTGACLLVRKGVFEAAGGFPEDLRVAYNDVALCMAIHRMGYENVVCTKNVLYHHESLSRGNDLSTEKLKRLKQERNTLYETYPEYRGKDPYYSEMLSHELGDTGTDPRFFEVRQPVQRTKGKVIRELPAGTEQSREEMELHFDPDSKEGYGVVLFENNAFFEKNLILKGSMGKIYSLKLADRYCEETAFWKQEQPNCALCGFKLEEPVQKLPKDQYEIGLQMKRRIGKKSYFDWLIDEDGKVVVLSLGQ